MNKPEKLILDYSKWRCGGGGANKLGDGDTALLNKEGWSCCLGLWHLQLGFTPEHLIGKGEPCELSSVVYPFAYDYYDASENLNDYYNTSLSRDAMKINDNEDTTTEEKIEQLTILLLTEGIQLEVINKP